MTLTAFDELAKAGVTIWLDSLNRAMLTNGELRRLIETFNVAGVTSNPSIFQAALSDMGPYETQLKQLRGEHAGPEQAAEAITVADVQQACDRLLPVWRASTGRDGRVSLEVDPRSAHDADAMTRQAVHLTHLVHRPNLMVKIPATDAGLTTITRATAHGISVNVTLIFSPHRYAQVAKAYLHGLEQAHADGHSLSTIHSVASFFVSRLDTEVDHRLDKTDGSPNSLRGGAGLALAAAAHEQLQHLLESSRWLALQRHGAQPQRLLWASTGVKDPTFEPTKYVTGLVTANTVNTMPPATLTAVAQLTGPFHDAVTGSYEGASKVLRQLTSAGIDVDDVATTLERQGVATFVTAWESLLTRLTLLLRAGD